MISNILRIDASSRSTGSVTRELADSIVSAFPSAAVTTRDLARMPVPQIDEGWIGANFTAEPDRSPDQRARLELSDRLVAEIEAADLLVIGLPIYNFGVPAALKAWIDQVARAGRTFRYTPEGPQGLLTGKRAIVAVASGGTRVGSEIDFATGYLAHVLGFIGITDVEFVTADRLMVDADASLRSAADQVALLRDAA